MNLKKLTAAILFLAILGLPGLSQAAHPLITDDTGTEEAVKNLKLVANIGIERNHEAGIAIRFQPGR